MRLRQLENWVRLIGRAQLATNVASHIVVTTKNAIRLSLGSRTALLTKLCFLPVLLLQIGITPDIMAVPRAYAATTDLGRQIPVTARLINPATRTPVVDGTYTVRYAIYSINRTTADAYPSDSDAGSRLWTETKDIKVINGILFNSLGSTTAIPSSIDFSSNDLYLGIRLSTDPEMVPRRKLGSVAHAISADNVQGYTPGSGAGQLLVTDRTTGGLAITNAPTASSTSSLVQLGSAISAGSASGTYLGINAASAFGGNLADFQVNGSSKFSIDASGNLAIAGSITGGTWAGTAIGVTKGGTGLTSVTTGDLLYASASNTLATLGISGSNGLCLVSNGTLPAWGSCSGGATSSLQAAYTAGNTITTTNGRDVSVTLINSAIDPNVVIDIATGSTGKFKVQGNSSDVFTIDVSGNVVANGTINTATISGGTLSGGAVSGGSLSATAVNGLSVAAGTITSPTVTGTVTGSSSPTITGFGTINGATLSGGTLSGGTYAATGATFTNGSLSSTSLALNGGAATISSTGANALSIDGGASGALNLNNASSGDILFGGGSASTGCTVTNSSGNFACTGTINGATITSTTFNSATISGGTVSGSTLSGTALTFSGASGAISTGTTDAVLTIDANGTGTVSIGATSTGNILLGGGSGATGCTLTNSTGDFACAGNITGASTGTAGYWSRSGTTIQPATAGDNVTTSGNISTTGSGAITSAGLLTGSAGLTISGGTVSLNTTGTAITAIGNATGTFQLTSSALNVTTLGALSGITTIATSSTINGATISGGTLSGGTYAATGATFTNGSLSSTALALNGGAATISSTGANALSIDGGASGALNLNNTSSGDILLGGGSASTGCTVTNTSGNFACTGTINGATISAGTLSGSTLSGTALTFSGASGAISVGTTDGALTINANGTGTIGIGGTSTGDILLGGGSAATGCTLTNSTGDFACAGNITGASTGTAGYWSRSGTTIQPANAGDAITTSGSITTTGSGTITAAGLITGTAGLTISGGTASINASGTSITTIGNATGTFQLTSSALNVTTLGALSGITTIVTSSTINTATISGGSLTGGTYAATGATFTNGSLSSTALALNGGAATVSSTGANALSVDGGSSGALNLNNTSSGDILLGGGSASTGCTVTNSTGALACSGNITGTTSGTVGYWSRSGTTIQPATAGDAITTSGTLTLSGTGAVQFIVSGAPAASASSSLIQIGSAIASGNANGTQLGVNTASGYTGNLLELQTGSSKVASLGSTGNLRLTGWNFSGVFRTTTSEGAFTDVTSSANSATAWNIFQNGAVVDDRTYFGYEPSSFTRLRYTETTGVRGSATVALEVCTGVSGVTCNAWTAISGGSDGSSGFNATGQILWTNAITKSTVNGVHAYWLRATVATANFTTQPNGVLMINSPGGNANNSVAFLIQPSNQADSSSWIATGTVFGINAGVNSSSDSNIVDFQSGGTSRFTIGQAGGITGGGTFTSSGATNAGFYASAATSSALRADAAPSASAVVSMVRLGATIAAGSANGNYYGINSASGFTGLFADYEVNGTSKFSINYQGNTAIGVAPTTHALELGTDDAVKPTTNTWTIASDARLKDNVNPFTDGLDKIMAIDPVTYTLNGKGGLPQGANGIGVIAQQVKDIVPYTIGTYQAKLNPGDANDTTLYNFNSGALTFVTINAIKELNSKVTTAQNQITSMQQAFNNPTFVNAHIDNLTVNASATINGSLSVKGTSTFVSTAPGSAALIAKGAEGQTANLVEIQSADGSVKFAIDASGHIVTGNALAGVPTVGVDPNSGANAGDLTSDSSALKPVAGSGLTLNIAAGAAYTANALDNAFAISRCITTQPTQISLTASATEYVYLLANGPPSTNGITCTLNHSSTLPQFNASRPVLVIAKVVTASSSITSVADTRFFAGGTLTYTNTANAVEPGSVVVNDTSTDNQVRTTTVTNDIGVAGVVVVGNRASGQAILMTGGSAFTVAQAGTLRNVCAITSSIDGLITSTSVGKVNACLGQSKTTSTPATPSVLVNVNPN